MQTIETYKNFRIVIGRFGNAAAPEANVFISPLGDDIDAQIARVKKAIDRFIRRRG